MGPNLPGFMPQPSDRNWNAASGWEYGGQELERQAARQHLLQQMMLDNQRQGLANDRFGQMTPHEVAVRAHDAERARQTTPLLPELLQGEVGKARTAAAQGEFDQATLPGKISTTKTGQQITGIEQSIRQLQIAAAHSPMMADVEYQRVLESNPQFKRFLPAHFDPSVLPALMNAVRDTPEHMRNVSQWDHTAARELQQEDMRQRGATERTRMTTEATRYSADRAYGRGLAAETPQRAIARLRRQLAENPDQPELVDEYRSYLEDNWNKALRDDPSISILRLRAMTAKDPAERQQALQQVNDARWRWFAENKIYLPRQFQGKWYHYVGPFGGDPNKQSNWKAR